MSLNDNFFTAGIKLLIILIVGGCRAKFLKLLLFLSTLLVIAIPSPTHFLPLYSRRSYFQFHTFPPTFVLSPYQNRGKNQQDRACFSTSLSVSLPFSITITTCSKNSSLFLSDKKKKKKKEKKMSELSVSSTSTPATTKKTSSFPSLLLSDFYLFCSFVLSHPLYFSYFIFFSPYLLKLLSFLSPLFITTFLLLLALLTFSSPGFVHHDNDLSETKVGFVLGTYQAVVNRLRCRVEDGSGAEEFHQYEELEVYKIVFDTLKHEDFGENPVEVLKLEVKESYSTAPEAQVQNSLSGEGFGIAVSEVTNGSSGGNTAVVTRPDGTELIAEEKSIAGFLHQKKDFDELPCRKREKEVKPLSVKSSKVEEEKEVQSFTRSGSKAMGHQIGEAKVIGYDGGDRTPELNSPRTLEANSWSPDHGADQHYNSQTSGPNLRGFGSMRREKEWRRTLACKLFEERHNVSDNNGGEGMDLLWETYETDSTKVQGKSKTNNKKGKKGAGVDHHHQQQHYHDVDEDQEEDEEEEENDNGQLCCLQALKFSAGKMNLGMGRPNLVKITKALKGIGWLHHVSKHGKKVHR